jgi:hypothetical protein
MKTLNTTWALVLVALLSISATVGISTLTTRSTSQVVIVKSDANALTSEMNTYYAKGYRVVSMVSQGWVSGNAYTQGGSASHSYTTPVIVVMEK